MKKKISIIVPVYNQEKNISSFLSKFNKILQSFSLLLDHEIIFVNNGSTDKSWLFISNLAQQNNLIKAVNLSRKFEFHGALKAGHNLASGDMIVNINQSLGCSSKIIIEIIKQAIYIPKEKKEFGNEPIIHSRLLNILNQFSNSTFDFLKVFGYLGIVILATGFFTMLYCIINVLFFDKSYYILQISTLIIYLFTGVQSILIWLIGEYRTRINEQQSTKPLYEVREFVNFDYKNLQENLSKIKSTHNLYQN